MLNVDETEAAKEKLHKIKTAFPTWIWTDPDRTDRLARIYNDRFNNLVPRALRRRHLTLPGASGAFVSLRAPEARHLAHHRRRRDLPRPRRRRRQDDDDRRRHHGADAGSA